jgi:hypothetical protein
VPTPANNERNNETGGKDCEENKNDHARKQLLISSKHEHETCQTEPCNSGKVPRKTKGSLGEKITAKYARHILKMLQWADDVLFTKNRVNQAYQYCDSRSKYKPHIHHRSTPFSTRLTPRITCTAGDLQRFRIRE